MNIPSLLKLLREPHNVCKIKKNKNKNKYIIYNIYNYITIHITCIYININMHI